MLWRKKSMIFAFGLLISCFCVWVSYWKVLSLESSERHLSSGWKFATWQYLDDRRGTELSRDATDESHGTQGAVILTVSSQASRISSISHSITKSSKESATLTPVPHTAETQNSTGGLLQYGNSSSEHHIKTVLDFIDEMADMSGTTGDPKKLLVGALPAAKDLRVKSVYDFIFCSQRTARDDRVLSPDFYNFTAVWGSSFPFECTALEEMRFMPSLEVRRKPPWPLTALASFPGSGNTLLRYLLEQVTGVFTGSSDCDMVLKRAGLLGESITSNNVLAIKTHSPSLMTAPEGAMFSVGAKFKSAVVLIRNPYDAILAEYQQRTLWSHVRSLEPQHYRENFTYWNDSFFRLVNAWTEFTDFWLSKDLLIPRTVVAFEHLISNRAGVLRKVVQFLNLSLDENKLNCVSNMVVPNAKRRRPGKKYYPYSASQILAVRTAINSVRVVLQNFGIDADSWIEFGSHL